MRSGGQLRAFPKGEQHRKTHVNQRAGGIWGKSKGVGGCNLSGGIGEWWDFIGDTPRGRFSMYNPCRGKRVLLSSIGDKQDK